MNCSNCQNPIAEGEKFCGKCGKETGAELSMGLIIFWKILLAMDVISVPIIVIAVVILSLTGIIFNDTGADNPMQSFFILGMSVAVICVALCIASFRLFYKRRARLGISLALIGALPVVLLLLYFTLGNSIVEMKMKNDSIKKSEWSDCLNKERAKKDSSLMERKDLNKNQKVVEFNRKYFGEIEKISKYCEDVTGYN